MADFSVDSALKQAVIKAVFAHVMSQVKIIFSCFIYRWSESSCIRLAYSHFFLLFIHKTDHLHRDERQGPTHERGQSLSRAGSSH